MRRPLRRELLRERLDALVATFDISTITPDPLQQTGFGQTPIPTPLRTFDGLSYVQSFPINSGQAFPADQPPPLDDLRRAVDRVRSLFGFAAMETSDPAGEPAMRRQG